MPTDRFGLLSGLLLVSVVLGGFGSDPLHDSVALVNALVFVVALSSTGAVRSRRGLALAALVGLVGFASVLTVDPGEVTGGVVWLVQVGLLIAVAIFVLRRVLEHERVGTQTILGAVCLYILLGMMFGVAYSAIDGFVDEPVLVDHVGGTADPLYYSFVTMTTVGFGDVTSTVDVVRRLTMVQAVIGQVFLVTMVARLVSLFGVVRRSN